MRVKGTGVKLVASIALLSLAAVVSACEDDENLVQNGAGGSAGKGQGGFAGTPSGGASGKGGATGGTAGASGGTAGSSGKGGTAGSSGKGGAAGGTAGASGKGGAAGGTAGASGKGGSAGAPAAGFDPAKTTTLTAPSVTLFDAVPSSDGKKVFFTGLDADGNGAVFSGAPGGTGALLGAADYVLPAAVALGSDGASLYVADLGASVDGPDGKVELKGQVFSVSTAGGAKTALAGLDGYGVRGLAVRKAGAADELVFSGTDPATGLGGVFKANATTGAAVLLSGTEVVREPSGVAVAGEDVFAIDAAGPALVHIPASGAVTRTPIRVHVGFPAGIAASADGKTLLLSSAETTMVLTFDIAAGTFSTTTVDKAAGTEGGGLHKAAAASVYALVDGTAGGTGAVYVLTP